ncbi:hypothetical protein [Natronococcus jeotgali]|uniref:Uncharacterized protein n=1 Tax=Natronococcus jeotgali DSM 18795 TaxID=1227498 RepID=L9XPE7_9EURY|nr:hypothetical protein [Natronococcus jeotgali]ELY63402.1 hypothetical protein C492_07180 [Natronococcus jeotgali DSM 18795]
MDQTAERLEYHIKGAFIGLLVLAAFQYWEGNLDIGFLVVVAAGYVILRMAFDIIQERYTNA